MSRVLFSFLVVAGTLSAYGQENAVSARLSVEEFALKMKELPDAPVVDIRKPEEYAQGHLPQAVNINWFEPDFIARMTLLGKDKPILIYCRAGNRSGQALEKLQAAGFVQVFEMKDGIVGWIEEDLELSKE